jgi:hypothetical protein
MFEYNEIVFVTEENNEKFEASQRTKTLRAIACEMDNYERFDILDD